MKNTSCVPCTLSPTYIRVIDPNIVPLVLVSKIPGMPREYVHPNPIVMCVVAILSSIKNNVPGTTSVSKFSGKPLRK